MSDSARKQLEQAAISRRILVVEDDDDSREMLVELIGMLGHRAVGASNATDAFQAVKSEEPEVVLIDIGLPDASGCDIAKTLRTSENGTRMRLVALTGYSDSATRKLAAEAGFDDFVVKPFSTENLATLLKAQL
jgi:DNA-binding response OmpR family regulator